MRKFRLISLSVLAAAAAILTPALCRAQDAPAAGTKDERTSFVSQVAQGRIPVPESRRMFRPAVNPIVRQAPAADAPELHDVIAKMVYNESWANPLVSGVGMYRLSTDPANPEVEEIVVDTEMVGSNGAARVGSGMYFMTKVNNGSEDIVVEHRMFNMNNWSLTSKWDGTVGTIAVSTTFNPYDNLIYGVFLSDDGFGLQFCRYDAFSHKRMALGSLSEPYSALAFDRDGMLYGINFDGNLVQINHLTGKTIKVIGEAKLPSEYLTSAIIDTEARKMIYAHATVDARALYSVDLATGVPEKICDYSDMEEFVGMYLGEDKCNNLAPAKPSFGTPSFKNGGLEGTVTLYMPNKTVDGKQLTGALAYTLECNGEAIATGECNAGKFVNLNITVDSKGYKEFRAYCSNDYGRGQSQVSNTYVGTVIPAAPKNVKLQAGETGYTLTWDPVTTCDDGTPIPSVPVYSVILYPSNERLTLRDCNDTSLSFTLQNTPAEAIYCGVTAVFPGKNTESEEALSNKYMAGVLIPPVYEYFSTAENAARWETMDGNGMTDGFVYNESYHRLEAVCPEDIPDDQWILSPEMFLEAGLKYLVTVDAMAGDPEEKIELSAGQGSMEELWKFDNKFYKATPVDNARHSAYLEVPEDGKWRLAIHTSGGMNSAQTVIRSIRVETPLAPTAPDAAADLTIKPDELGELKAEISFKTPANDVSGNPLTDLTKAELSRNGNTIRIWENPAPGETFTYTDDQIYSAGTYTYSVICAGASGQGIETSASAFIGYPQPAAPENVEMDIEPITGKITLTWDEVTTDFEGNPINPKAVKYFVLKGKGGSGYDDDIFIASNIEGTSYSFMPDDTVQSYYGFYVGSHTGGGDCFMPTSTEGAFIGPAYTLPYTESVANARFNHEWIIQKGEGSHAIFSQVQDSDEITSQDNDGACLRCGQQGPNGKAALISGRIHFDCKNKPILSFWYYGQPGSTATVSVALSENRAEPVVKQTYNFADGEGYKWNHVVLPLDEYKGKVAQLYFDVSCGNTHYVYLDNIALYDGYDDNLSLTMLTLPNSLQPGQESIVETVVHNFGINVAKNWKVQLYRGGEDIGAIDGVDLEAGEAKMLRFTDKIDRLYEGKVEYSAVIDFDDDEYADDDEKSGSIEFIDLLLPLASGISGVKNSEGVALSWVAPEMKAGVNVMRRDGAELYEPFSIGLETSLLAKDYVGDWTMHDADGYPTRKLINEQDKEVDYINAGAEMAFIVYDPLLAQTYRGYSHLYPYSGSRYFASFQPLYKEANDLMISPELSGNAQTISFYASRPYSGAEALAVYSSDTDPDLKSLSLVKVFNTIEKDWRRYDVDLPEGAKYFAINCRSQEGVMVMIDDIIYEAKARDDEFSHLKLLGYNLYRDGKRVNKELLTQPAATDKPGNTGSFRYAVTAVYDAGESAPCAEYVYTPSGLDAAAADNVSVFTRRGHIYVTGADGKQVIVSSADGKLICNTRHAAASVDAEVPAGVYVVSVDGKAVKVIVR